MWLSIALFLGILSSGFLSYIFLKIIYRNTVYYTTLEIDKPTFYILVFIFFFTVCLAILAYRTNIKFVDERIIINKFGSLREEVYRYDQIRKIEYNTSIQDEIHITLYFNDGRSLSSTDTSFAWSNDQQLVQKALSLLSESSK